jgi:hypothetical protein
LDGEHVVAFVIGVASTLEAFGRRMGSVLRELWRVAGQRLKRRQLCGVSPPAFSATPKVDGDAQSSAAYGSVGPAGA